MINLTGPRLLITEREYKVLLRRIEGKTLEKIGHEFKVTRERVRQIEARALRKLQTQSEIECPHYPRGKTYEGFLEVAIMSSIGDGIYENVQIHHAVKKKLEKDGRKFSRDSVNMQLSKLTQKGKLLRLAQGVYSRYPNEGTR